MAPPPDGSGRPIPCSCSSGSSAPSSCSLPPHRCAARAPPRLGLAQLTTDQVVAHVQRVALLTLEGTSVMKWKGDCERRAARRRGLWRERRRPPRASGYVEATEVRVSAEVGGRLLEVTADEGRRVAAGDVLARIDTADLEIARRRADADRDQAAAQLRLLQAGARAEDVRQARAQAQSARAELTAAEAELAPPPTTVVASTACSRRTPARASNATMPRRAKRWRRARVTAADERVRAADEGVARLRAGARREELAAADARVAVADAQLAAIDKSLADATVTAPVARHDHRPAGRRG